MKITDRRSVQIFLRSFAVIFLSAVSFCFSQKGNCSAYISRLTRTECVKDCPKSEVSYKIYKKGNLNLKFGIVTDCCNSDSLGIIKCGDTLFLRTTRKKEIEEIVKNDSVKKRPKIYGCECECYFDFDVVFSGLKVNPRFIVVNNFISDDKLGFINIKTKEKNEMCCPDAPGN